MLLALNTAFMSANVGISTEKGDFKKTVDAKSKHAEIVLKTIDELCEENNCKIAELEKMYVVVGPGSFTGIRIGVAIAKGFGAVNESLKIYPISSLDLIAYIYQKQAKDNFMVVLDAHSNLFFVCEYDKDGHKLSEEKLIDIDNLKNCSINKVYLVGDLSFDGPKVEISTQDLLDYAKNIEINEVKAEELNPVYIRPSQAEANSQN